MTLTTSKQGMAYYGFICPECGNPIISRIKITVVVEEFKLLRTNNKQNIIDKLAAEVIQEWKEYYTAFFSNSIHIHAPGKSGSKNGLEYTALVDELSVECPCCDKSVSFQSSNEYNAMFFNTLFEAKEWTKAIVFESLTQMEKTHADQKQAKRLHAEKNTIEENLNDIKERKQHVQLREELQKIEQGLQSKDTIGYYGRKKRNSLLHDKNEIEEIIRQKDKELSAEENEIKRRYYSICAILSYPEISVWSASNELSICYFIAQKGAQIEKAKEEPFLLPKVIALNNQSKIPSNDSTEVAMNRNRIKPVLFFKEIDLISNSTKDNEAELQEKPRDKPREELREETKDEKPVFCIYCGTEQPPKSKFCYNCGKPIIQKPQRCKQCNMELPENSAYCPFCGERINSK